MITTKLLAKYKNGNTRIKLYTDGTKIRKYKGVAKPIFPDSMDIKITNSCDLGCFYCHEESIPQGKHANIKTLLRILDKLPKGIELAIGGGNPLAHPSLLELLVNLKHKGFIVNMTVNQMHLDNIILKYALKHKLINALGISITDTSNLNHITKFINKGYHIVFHVIVGIHMVKVIEILMQFNNARILVLGYKQFGRGKTTYSEHTRKQIHEWYINIFKYLNKAIIGFDNLALDQLKLKRFFTNKDWSNLYMGDEFAFSMYIDAVEETYGESSTFAKRTPFNDITLIDYFQNEHTT